MSSDNQFQSFLQSLTRRQYSEQHKVAVWVKARAIEGYNPAYVRMDACGAPIEWVQYGNTSSAYGWEIDHINPESLGGINNVSNLQPLQWQNNRKKSNAVGTNYCVVRSY